MIRNNKRAFAKLKIAFAAAGLCSGLCLSNQVWASPVDEATAPSVRIPTATTSQIPVVSTPATKSPMVLEPVSINSLDGWHRRSAPSTVPCQPPCIQQTQPCQPSTTTQPGETAQQPGKQQPGQTTNQPQGQQPNQNQPNQQPNANPLTNDLSDTSRSQLSSDSFAASSGGQSASPQMVGDDPGGRFRALSLPSTFTTRGENRIIGQGLMRSKIGEQNSPMTNDRFSLSFNRFEGATIFSSGDGGVQKMDINRYTAAFEKTFFNGAFSAEVRVPFATTANSDINTFSNQSTNSVFQSTDSATEFGNVALNFKTLIVRSSDVNVSVGLGVSLPTADDTRVFLDNRQILQVNNESLHLQPFIGALITPNDRLFAQGFVQADFDTRGNDVFDNNGVKSGTLQDQTLLYIDAAVGYWIYRDTSREGLINGIAPVIEAHYTTTLNDADIIQTNVGNSFNRFDGLNMTCALHMEIGNNIRLTNGVAFPLLSGESKTFDFEYQCQLFVNFGPKYRDYPMAR